MSSLRFTPALLCADQVTMVDGDDLISGAAVDMCATADPASLLVMSIAGGNFACRAASPGPVE
jgi:hypothetical protein